MRIGATWSPLRIGLLILSTAAIGVVLFVAWFVLPASVHYRVTERYVFSSSDVASPVYLAVIVPQTGPYQTVENLSIDWAGTYGEARAGSVRVLRFEGKLARDATLEAAITYEIVLNQGTVDWVEPVRPEQLRPQKNIESDTEVLESESARILQGQTGDGAYEIYSFTARYLVWPQGSRTNVLPSALEAYQSRVGGCAEFANLGVALYRAGGYPARAVVGLALPSYPPWWSETREWGHPGGAHAWMEVNTGERWQLADASWGSAWPDAMKWLWYGRSDGSHLSYGESGQYDDVYDEMMAWGAQRGTIVGAMSQPLHFVAASDTPGAQITPQITLIKGWDGRWVVVVGLYAGMLIFVRWADQKLVANAQSPKPTAA